MNRCDDGVRLGGQKTVDVARDFALLDLSDAGPAGPDAANQSRGRLSSAANQTGTFFPSTLSYSLIEVNGTKQQFGGDSQRF